MAEEQRCQEGHRLCANNCGFFGSSATLNLCSKCYRDLCLKEEQASSAKIVVEKSLSSPPSPTALTLDDNSSPTVKASPLSIPESSSTVKASPLSIPESSSSTVKASPLSVPESSSTVKASPFSVSQSSPAVKASPLAVPESSPAVKATPLAVPDVDSASPLAAPATSTEAPARPGRCSCCRKRVGLTGFVCKCGATFCGSHRYPEQHACGFDYKSVGREALARANPVVKAAKLDRI